MAEPHTRRGGANTMSWGSEREGIETGRGVTGAIGKSSFVT